MNHLNEWNHKKKCKHLSLCDGINDLSILDQEKKNHILPSCSEDSDICDWLSSLAAAICSNKSRAERCRRRAHSLSGDSERK